MSDSEENFTQMGVKPIGSVNIIFYTNPEKDALFLQGEIKDKDNQLPNATIIKRLTQSLKGTVVDSGIQQFLQQLKEEKKTDIIHVLTATPAQHGNGKSFVQSDEADLVKTGDIVGTLSAPEAGVDGSNLFGQVIKGTRSEEINFSFDDSVYIKGTTLIAYREGKVIYDDLNHTLTIDAPFKITISEDKMKAHFTYLDLVPLTAELIHKVIEEEHITFGILQDKIDEAVKIHADTKKPIKDFLVAQGIPLKETKQGRIIYSFETTVARTFEEDKKGKIDHRANNSIQSVNEGERIAIIKPPKEGIPGRNIIGITIAPKPPKEAQLKALKNVRSNKENTEFYAEKNGTPIYKRGTISVVDIMQVEGDLNLSTGNIDFDGSISIEGDVGDDYSLKAEGDIFIGGSVGGSKIFAGGSIQIGKGFNARGNGTAECLGNFSAKFLNEAKVLCEKDLIIENEILNSDVKALGKLIMPEGKLMGGTTTVLSGIFVRDIGSPLGITSTLFPGVNFLYSDRKEGFEKQLKTITERTEMINNTIGPILKDKLKLAILPKDKKANVLNLVNELKTLKADRELIQSELENFLDDNKSNRINEVTVFNVLYPGSIVKIGHSQKDFKTESHGPLLITEDIMNSTVKTGPIKMKNSLPKSNK
ncbi:MAG: hypothetical protein COA79_24005 [Planctomycetota bacterium]|nr:MAG: hypothetical protein COA79_24005 [Planctomycetota bacterium]